MDKIGTALVISGLIMSVAGFAALGVLFKGHYYAYLTHLTGNKICSLASLIASSSLIACGFGAMAWGGSRKPKLILSPKDVRDARVVRFENKA